jgi:hypothetical protein
MMGLLTYVLADCPDALIWNQIDSNEIEMEQQWLSGSPFDKLSFTIDDFFAQDDGPANNLLRTRISEIKSRSLNASNYWASCIKNGSDTLVELCLDILYYLDTTSLNESGAVNKMHDAIFCSSNVV